ncbi:unnamed protein product [Brassicogethes aeneus]|uniref:Peptidase S1 domain-containing protein n=1 Tax=Brassicogethes aeneus TaxID=1431903 RepID=A0A9P0FHV6_BRAAE|nr:unnamed protein product [Brassicogethes aeneus]
MQCAAILLIFLLLSRTECGKSESGSTEQNATRINTKIIVNPNTNWFNSLHHHNSRPKPTTAKVEFEAGVPPGWPSRKTTGKPPRPLRLPADFNKTTFEAEIFNQTINTEDFTITENATHDEFVLGNQTNKVGGFVDWVLGIVGIRPEEESTPRPIPDIAKNCPVCNCGITHVNTRIVGGIETKVNMYPWMVALMYNNRFYCGASLINNRYILTAAHCVNGFTRERLTAVFLDHDRGNTFETRTISRKISRVLKHKNYGIGGNYNNDIAILQLDNEVSTTGLLKPVCLPETGKSFTGLKGIAVGWGATKEHGQVSNRLREVEVPIMSNADCTKTGYGNRITDNMICAGYPEGKKDSCQGDSGGPMHVINNNHHELAGIVSWGEGCAEANYPGVYTRVNRFITWIKSNTMDACYC